MFVFSVLYPTLGLMFLLVFIDVRSSLTFAPNNSCTHHSFSTLFYYRVSYVHVLCLFLSHAATLLQRRNNFLGDIFFHFVYSKMDTFHHPGVAGDVLLLA